MARDRQLLSRPPFSAAILDNRHAPIQRHLQAISAILLSVPLIGSAANHVFKWVKPPLSDGSRGVLLILNAFVLGVAIT